MDGKRRGGKERTGRRREEGGEGGGRRGGAIFNTLSKLLTFIFAVAYHYNPCKKKQTLLSVMKSHNKLSYKNPRTWCQSESIHSVNIMILILTQDTG